MEKSTFLILIGMFICQNAISQARKTYKVMPGQMVSQALPPDVMYRYPAFSDGFVHFRNSALGSGKMNYNNLLGKIQFIDGNTDTLELTNDPPISFVIIATDTFYFEKKWMELGHARPNIILAKSSVLNLINRQRKGAMGVISEGSVNPVTQLSFNGRPLRELPTDEILTFAFQYEYFTGDRFGHFKPANKKGFLSLYGTKDKQIEAYLAENPVDFSMEEDLIRLTDFIDSLF
jgi:hypothetical protein